jgi:predicted MFS family arabinose efflux permease
LLAQPGVRWILAGTAIASIGGYGALAFTPSFLVRSHHMTPAAIGFTLAMTIGIFGWAGTAFPGLLAQRWKPDDIGFGLRISSVALMLVLPFHIVFYLVPDLHIALMALIPRVFASAIFLGPCFAILQHQASADMRSQATALLLLVLNLVGLSLGPQLVGIISSLLQSRFGEEALRYALAIVSTAPVVPAAICFWLAAQALRTSKRTS